MSVNNLFEIENAELNDNILTVHFTNDLSISTGLDIPSFSTSYESENSTTFSASPAEF